MTRRGHLLVGLWESLAIKSTCICDEFDATD